MASDVIQSVWPLLALLAFTLVTCVLSVLASYRRHAIDVHDRIRESKEMRQRYLRTVEQKNLSRAQVEG